MNNSLFLHQIENEIAQLLISKTHDQELDESHCSQIAKQVLELFPENINIELLEKSLPKLKEIYSELASLSIKYQELINDKRSEEQIEQIKHKISNILYGTTRN